MPFCDRCEDAFDRAREAGSGTQQLCQQLIRLRRERIYNCHPVPGKTIVQVLGEEQAATGGCSGGKHDRIPNSEAMTNGEIHRREYHLIRGLYYGKSILPVQHRFLGMLRRESRFPNKKVK